MPEVSGYPISVLPTAGDLDGSEVLAGVQNAITKKFTLAVLLAYIDKHIVSSDALVPATRTVNGHALTQNIILDANDVGTLDAENIAKIEDSDTATNSYFVGNLFIMNGTLYKATATIAVGDTIIVSQNCVAVTLADILQELESNIDDLTLHVGTISFSAIWTGESSPYTQTVIVRGATITSNSKIDLQPTAIQISRLINDGVTGLVIENNDGILTAYAVGAAPSVVMTVQCTVEEIV